MIEKIKPFSLFKMFDEAFNAVGHHNMHSANTSTYSRLNRMFRNSSLKLIQEVDNIKTNIFRCGTYGPWRQFMMLGTIYTEGNYSLAFTGTE